MTRIRRDSPLLRFAANLLKGYILTLFSFALVYVLLVILDCELQAIEASGGILLKFGVFPFSTLVVAAMLEAVR